RPRWDTCRIPLFAEPAGDGLVDLLGAGHRVIDSEAFEGQRRMVEPEKLDPVSWGRAAGLAWIGHDHVIRSAQDIGRGWSGARVLVNGRNQIGDDRVQHAVVAGADHRPDAGPDEVR